MCLLRSSMDARARASVGCPLGVHLRSWTSTCVYMTSTDDIHFVPNFVHKQTSMDILRRPFVSVGPSFVSMGVGFVLFGIDMGSILGLSVCGRRCISIIIGVRSVPISAHGRPGASTDCCLSVGARGRPGSSTNCPLVFTNVHRRPIMSVGVQVRPRAFIWSPCVRGPSRTSVGCGHVCPPMHLHRCPGASKDDHLVPIWCPQTPMNVPGASSWPPVVFFMDACGRQFGVDSCPRTPSCAH